MSNEYEPRPLPDVARKLCKELQAPPRLVAHLLLVHDAAVELVNLLEEHIPECQFDTGSVLFGAAVHDLGKVLHPHELTGPGRQHEVDGPSLLESHGVPPHFARFSRTHGTWSSESLPLEDLLISLGDCVWKGQRLEALELLVVQRVAENTGTESWEVFDKLDRILAKVADRGEERLSWQASH